MPSAHPPETDLDEPNTPGDAEHFSDDSSAEAHLQAAISAEIRPAFTSSLDLLDVSRVLACLAEPCLYVVPLSSPRRRGKHGVEPIARAGQRTPQSVDSRRSRDCGAQMALFYLPDEVTLAIHIPRATHVLCGPSAARQAGFILRRGREIVNIGPLGRTIWR